MSDISYDRCSNDDWKAGTAQIGVNPDTGQPVELNIHGVASVIAVQSALLTVSAAMKNGHEEDFLEKVALCLFENLTEDPHALCPLLTICSMCLLMLTKQAGVTFDKKGCVVIAPPNVPIESGATCIFDNDEKGESYGTDEGTVDGIGPGPTGGNSGEGETDDGGEGLQPA